jgi:glycosyltransferase involved in cell wall biosynthesis
LINIAHLAQDSDTSGYFPQLARWHDRTRYRMLFATLGPMAPWLREYMVSQGVECFSGDCRGRWQYPIGLLRLMRFLRSRRVDVLHTHLFDPSVVGLLAGFLAQTPVRTMTRHHSDYHTRINKRWHVRLDQLCTALCHRVIAVSEHTAQVMREEERAPVGRLRVIHNGIDFDRMRLSSPEAPDALRRQYAPCGEFLILQVARLHPEKGHEYLFRALRLIRERLHRPVRLLVAGTGSSEGDYRRLVRELGIDDQVVFTGFRSDVPDLMAAADVLMLPSVAEAFGFVLTEALYLGTPVIACRVGGIPEIITHGVDGLLVPPASPVALADAVIESVRDEGRRSRMAAVGRQKVINKFGFEQMMRRYETLYAEMLAGTQREIHAAGLRGHSHL